MNLVNIFFRLSKVRTLFAPNSPREFTPLVDSLYIILQIQDANSYSLLFYGVITSYMLLCLLTFLLRHLECEQQLNHQHKITAIASNQ